MRMDGRVGTGLLVAGLLVAGCLAALANGGGYTYGVPRQGAVRLFQPAGLEAVEMRRERLDIALRFRQAHIDIEYELHHPGTAPVTIEAGFPCTAFRDVEWWGPWGEPSGDASDTLGRPIFRDFTILADGATLPWTFVADASEAAGLVPTNLEDGFDHDSDADLEPEDDQGKRLCWHTFKLAFGPGQTRTVRVSYDTPYFGEDRFVSDDRHVAAPVFIYLFSPAAIWKGPIREGEVSIRAVAVDPDLVLFNRPGRFSRAGNTWTWRFTDLEPGFADDLRLLIRPGYTVMSRLENPASRDGEAERWIDFLESEGRWSICHAQYRAKASSSLPSRVTNKDEADRAREHSSGDDAKVATITRTYGPGNLADKDLATAWVEGVEGDGIGESVTLTLNRPRPLSAIGVRTGLCRSPDVFRKNGRVAGLRITLDGRPPVEAALPDELIDGEYWFVRLPEDWTPVKKVHLVITAVHPGSKYQDTAMSDLVLVTPLKQKPEIRGCR